MISYNHNMWYKAWYHVHGENIYIIILSQNHLVCYLIDIVSSNWIDGYGSKPNRTRMVP